MNLSLIDNNDLFAITETWLKTTGDEASIVELTPINNAFINQPRPKNIKTDRGVGVGLMYRRFLFHAKRMSPLCEIKTLELLRMQISSTSGRRFCIYIVYRPPRGTKLSGTETEFYSDLDILFTDASISTIPVIFLGDFNDEPKYSRLHNMLNDYQIQQHVHSSTHKNDNILDLGITHQRDNLVSNISVMDYAMSDHYCVECTLNVSIKPVKARFEQKRAVRHIQMGVFVNDIKVKNTQMRTEELSVDKILDAYNSTLSVTLNKHAPLKKTQVKTQPHPCYNEDIKDARLYNNNNNNNNNCLKSNIQCIEIRVQWTVHLGSSHMHVYVNVFGDISDYNVPG